MAHSAKKPRVASKTASPSSQMSRSLTSHPAAHRSLTSVKARAASSGKSTSARTVKTVTAKAADQRGKTRTASNHEAKTAYKPYARKATTTTVVKKAAKRAEPTTYGAAKKTKASHHVDVKGKHTAKAAHLPHNGTAHHEQYKK